MEPGVSTKLTYADYCLLPDDGRRHEIIDGEHYVNPSPNTKHQTTLRNLAYELLHHMRLHPVGEVFFAPFDVVLSNFDVVEPDLIFISEARKHILTKANVQGAPDLVVEVLSPSTRDYDEVVKFRRYAAMGIPEYWIIDPEFEIAKIYRQHEGMYVITPTADTLSTPLIPYFSLLVRELFE